MADEQEAPPKEEEEIRLEFLEMFQEGVQFHGKRKIQKKRKKRSQQVLFRLTANC